MSSDKFLHELPDVKVLFEQLSRTEGIVEQLIEKDYWIMHCLWGLKAQGFNFELKGGTSLSKGFQIIARFSEDLDIKIQPPKEMYVATGKNQDKSTHQESRRQYYDWLASEITIAGITTERDTSYDDVKARSGGIRLVYQSFFQRLEGVKPFILLEPGFDVTTPNENRLISSWVYDAVIKSSVNVIDNRAIDVPCYLPGYTFVEKLSAISAKFRKEQAGSMPSNFLRHYYDVFKLLEDDSVLSFIGTAEYMNHKALRFRKDDELDVEKNEAFLLSKPETRKKYIDEYNRTGSLYYSDFPSFESILERIQSFADRL